VNPYCRAAKPNDIRYKEDIVILSTKKLRANKILVLSKDIVIARIVISSFYYNDQVAAIAMFSGHDSQILFMIKLPNTFFSNLTEVSNAAAATFRHKGSVLV
jgi:hypothetical protein